VAIEAARIALKYRTPVYLLSDAYLAHGSEPWLVPEAADLPDIAPEFATEPNDGDRFLPYVRDGETLARQWALPGTAGLEHRIGGLEKEDRTGNISYEPDNHDLMVRVRAQKVAGIADDIPEQTVDHQEGANLLVLSWGGTRGPVAAGVRRAREQGFAVAHSHLAYLNPFPRNLGSILHSYDRVLVPEMNLGQLLKLVRAEYLVDAVGFQRVRGVPFTSGELAVAMGMLA
jgi:2-oxoglutarate ferredoxin oxidoreductase subunit alpha